MTNAKLVIGAGIIEAALKKQPNLVVEKLELVPPDRMEVTLMVALPVGGQSMALHPTAIIQLAAQDGRLKLQLESINLLGVAVPAVLVEGLVSQELQGPEAEANGAIQAVSSRTGLMFSAASVTNDSLVLEFK